MLHTFEAGFSGCAEVRHPHSWRTLNDPLKVNKSSVRSSQAALFEAGELVTEAPSAPARARGRRAAAPKGSVPVRELSVLRHWAVYGLGLVRSEQGMEWLIL